MGEEQRVIAILGAGGTLGAAISRQLASEPLTALVVSDISPSSLEATIGGLPDNGAPVETVLADVSDFGQVEAVVERARRQFG
ncbi:MAG: SDR family NAD(P)-dependent oxidoreductase, partial [Acidimicrobiales bacterium]